jgi:hypothetical protein
MVSQSLRKKKPESRRAFLAQKFIASCDFFAERCVALTHVSFASDCDRKRTDVAPRINPIVGTCSAASTRYRFALANASVQPRGDWRPEKRLFPAGDNSFQLQGFKGSGGGVSRPGLGARTLGAWRVRSLRLARSSTSEGTTGRDELDLELEFESPNGEGAGPRSAAVPESVRPGRARAPREGRTGGGDERSRLRRPVASPASTAVIERRGARVPDRAAVIRGGTKSCSARRRARLYSRKSSFRLLGSFSRRYWK